MEDPIFMAYTAEKQEEKNHHSRRQRFMSTAKSLTQTQEKTIRFFLKNEEIKAHAFYLQTFIYLDFIFFLFYLDFIFCVLARHGRSNWLCWAWRGLLWQDSDVAPAVLVLYCSLQLPYPLIHMQD